MSRLLKKSILLIRHTVGFFIDFSRVLDKLTYLTYSHLDENMKTCVHCKSEMHDKASVCPHCGQRVIGAGYFIVMGLGLAGCGIWLIWIPLIGFSMIGFGLLLFLIGIVILFAKIVNKIVHLTDKPKTLSEK